MGKKKKKVSTSQKNQFSLAGIRLFFKNWMSPMVSISRKKPRHKRIPFQVNRISVSTSRNEEFVQ